MLRELRRGFTLLLSLRGRFLIVFAKVISEEVVNSDRPDPYAWVLEGVDLGAGK